MRGNTRHRSSCAACKQLKRRCDAPCILAPHFPLTKTREFEAVRKVFGTNNIIKMLSDLDPQGRIEAVKSLEWEALMWQNDPVHGPLGAFMQLQRKQQQESGLNLELKLMSQLQDSAVDRPSQEGNFQSCDGNKVNAELGMEIGELGQDGNSDSEVERGKEDSAIEGNVDQSSGRTQS
ncbi:LOB domain-containing protein 24-like [Lotus japonicus]|uniref:LOB domain-containing protein 24-like n=1 Tax=Lotus japonicus TaxID=34305 RepID=UPI0025846539|nr:LOB domain-containing protein 24-like [Lotus japonicus]